MDKRINKKVQKEMESWIWKNGACSFDYKNRDIILHDGGLFSIEKEKRRARKIVGYKKLPNGMTEILFSKTKSLWVEDYKAIFWMEELDETINYLKSMKRMLNKLGIDTGLSIRNKKRKSLNK
jgi:hypothetical protein